MQYLIIWLALLFVHDSLAVLALIARHNTAAYRWHTESFDVAVLLSIAYPAFVCSTEWQGTYCPRLQFALYWAEAALNVHTLDGTNAQSRFNCFPTAQWK
jgi:hypothetical protein